MFTAYPLGLTPSSPQGSAGSLAASGQLSCNFPLLHFMLLLQVAPLALSSATLSWPGVFSLWLLSCCYLKLCKHSLKTYPQNLGHVYSFLLESRLVESVTYHLHSSEAGHFPHYKRVDRSHKKLKHHLKTAIWEGGLLIAAKKYKNTTLLKKPKIKSPWQFVYVSKSWWFLKLFSDTRISVPN